VCLALSSSCSPCRSVYGSFVLAQALFSSLSACLLIHGLHLSCPFALLLLQISQTSIKWQGGLNCKLQIGLATAECSARRLRTPHGCDQSCTIVFFLPLCLGPCLCLQRGEIEEAAIIWALLDFTRLFFGDENTPRTGIHSSKSSCAFPSLRSVSSFALLFCSTNAYVYIQHGVTVLALARCIFLPTLIDVLVDFRN